MQLVLKLFDLEAQSLDLVGQKAVHRPQLGGVIRGDIKVLQHRRSCSGSGTERESRIDQNHQYLLAYPTLRGRHVFCGIRQSIPSSSIDNCAGVTLTLPSFAAGQTNRPFSRRLLNRQAP